MPPSPPLRVLCALSSGVDSSVSALLCLRPSPPLLRSLQSVAVRNGWGGKVGDEGTELKVGGIHMSSWEDHDNPNGGQYCETSNQDYR